jgi:hypothetical protein
MINAHWMNQVQGEVIYTIESPSAKSQAGIGG